MTGSNIFYKNLRPVKAWFVIQPTARVIEFWVKKYVVTTVEKLLATLSLRVDRKWKFVSVNDLLH